MRDALLAALKARSNRDGLVLARADVLQKGLRCSFDELNRDLAALSEAGRVEILSPLPFLVLVLRPRSWPGINPESVKSPHKTGVPAARSYSYSFHNQSVDESKAIAREDRGLGEGEALLKEILATLEESDPTSFRGVLEHYPAATIRAALRRVRSTPPEKLRKSRTALFRFLLAKTK